MKLKKPVSTLRVVLETHEMRPLSFFSLGTLWFFYYFRTLINTCRNTPVILKATTPIIRHWAFRGRNAAAFCFTTTTTIRFTIFRTSWFTSHNMSPCLISFRLDEALKHFAAVYMHTVLSRAEPLNQFGGEGSVAGVFWFTHYLRTVLHTQPVANETLQQATVEGFMVR